MKLIEINGVRGYIDDNGTAQLNLEDVSRGLGFTQTAASGNEVVRWERVNKYLAELKFIPTSGYDQYIPENIFYRLAMKAKNETAEIFQSKVADEILPTIRKTGSYSIQPQLALPQNYKEALLALVGQVEKNEVLETEKLMLQQQVKELEPKASYLDRILQSKDTVSITQIAKDYGLTGQQLNQILHDEKVQYKQSGQWLLYQKYQDKGFTKSQTIDVLHNSGQRSVRMNTKWSQKGRLFIHELLGKQGIIPSMDKDHSQAN